MSTRGCSDGGCPFRRRGGMHTNGGCHCFGDSLRLTPTERAQLRKWVAEMRDELEQAKSELVKALVELDEKGGGS